MTYFLTVALAVAADWRKTPEAMRDKPLLEAAALMPYSSRERICRDNGVELLSEREWQDGVVHVLRVLERGQQREAEMLGRSA
jgi:hypothetical protein